MSFHIREGQSFMLGTLAGVSTTLMSASQSLVQGPSVLTGIHADKANVQALFPRCSLCPPVA